MDYNRGRTFNNNGKRRNSGGRFHGRGGGGRGRHHYRRDNDVNYTPVNKDGALKTGRQSSDGSGNFNRGRNGNHGPRLPSMKYIYTDK
jgi:hypothetical protein